jgi:hypothetical protein
MNIILPDKLLLIIPKPCLREVYFLIPRDIVNKATRREQQLSSKSKNRYVKAQGIDVIYE